MKLLRVINTLAPSSGGPAQGIRNSIAALGRLDCNNEVVCLDDPVEAAGWGDAFPVHAIGRAKGPWAHHAGLLPWLEANAGRFDAVIVHGLWLYHSFAVRKVLRCKKTPPYFIFPHGMLDPWFQKAPERRMKAWRNWLYWKLIEQKVVRDAAGLLFTCEEELRLARTTFRPYQPCRELNVGYGISEPPFFHVGMQAAFQEKCPAVQDRPYLLFLSRIHPKKGVDLLIQAYADWARGSAASIRPDLVIAGPGLDSPYGTEMQALAASLGLKNAVHFPGMLTGDSKWGAFYGCGAFVLPSHQENFGIAVVEALACGKPVLISNQVNIWREIQEAGAGIVEPDSPAGVRQMLSRWSQIHASALPEMAAFALACYKANYQTQQVVTRLLTALQS